LTVRRKQNTGKKVDYMQTGRILVQDPRRGGNPYTLHRLPDANQQNVRCLDIIPVEVIWRNYAAGSLLRRYGTCEVKLPEEGAPIPGGMIEFTTKFEAVDRPVDMKEILFNGWMNELEIEHITDMTRRINTILSRELYGTGIILADFMVEYGRTKNSEILLADEVGTPEGCRFWDENEFENGVIKSLDKDVFRKGVGDLSTAYGELQELLLKQEDRDGK
jgi:phosphoribosylaminoimidazole-succinocarboxamide synthase